MHVWQSQVTQMIAALLLLAANSHSVMSVYTAVLLESAKSGLIQKSSQNVDRAN